MKLKGFILILICFVFLSCKTKRTKKVDLVGLVPIHACFFGLNKPSNRISKKPETLYFENFYEQLSEQFNIAVSITELNDNFVTSKICVSILDKNDSLRQIIQVNAEVVGPIRDVSHVRSYETRFNEHRKLEDPEFHGEIVIGDFNFDSLSDIAIVDLIPMSGTPSYTYYLQKENLNFEFDSYLTNEVGNLPQKMNSSKKIFMAYYHTGCCAQTYRYFKFDENGKCRLTYTKEIDLNRE